MNCSLYLPQCKLVKQYSSNFGFIQEINQARMKIVNASSHAPRRTAVGCCFSVFRNNFRCPTFSSSSSSEYYQYHSAINRATLQPVFCPPLYRHGLLPLCHFSSSSAGLCCVLRGWPNEARGKDEGVRRGPPVTQSEDFALQRSTP